MRTTIIGMLRFGSHYSVSLECGHKYDASLGEANQRQLDIGKRVLCRECDPAQGEGRES